MRLFLSAFFLLLALHLQAGEYEIVKIPVYGPTSSAPLSVPPMIWMPISLNDRGEAVGARQTEEQHLHHQQTCFFYSPILLPAHHLLRLTFPKQRDWSWEVPVKINNHAVVLGNYQATNQRCGAFVWHALVGFRKIFVFDSSYVVAHDLNDLGQVIGEYAPQPLSAEQASPTQLRPFLWDNGTAVDMGPGSHFAQKIEQLGYSVQQVQLHSINNQGQLAGRFWYSANQASSAENRFEWNLFFYDGVSMHVRPGTYAGRCLYIIDLNDHQTVLLSTSTEESGVVSTTFPALDTKSFLWTTEEELYPLPDGFCGIALNDAKCVLGHLKGSFEPALWKEGSLYTLSMLLGRSIQHLAPPYSEQHAIERIVRAVDLNNHQELLCSGVVWGEQLPCLAKPKK